VNALTLIHPTSNAQTVWLRIYVNTGVDQNIVLFDGGANSSNCVDLNAHTTLGSYGEYRGTTLGAKGVVASSAYTSGVWLDVAYSWDPAIEVHSVYSGSSWITESGITPPMDVIPTGFNVGHGGNYLYMGETPSSSPIYVDKIYIVDGLRATKP
jgi:hypothetical protein